MITEAMLADLRPVVGTSPILRIKNGRDGYPVAATAWGRVDVSPKAVWKALSDVRQFAGRVPMIDHVEVIGDVVDFELKFGVSLLSVRFSFQTRMQAVEGKSLTLTYESGEPKDMEMSFYVEPIAGNPDASLFGVHIGFDAHSIGWLAKFFFKRHPEIQFGVHSGSALTLFDAMTRAARGRP